MTDALTRAAETMEEAADWLEASVSSCGCNDRLRALAAELRGMGWREIESAPKDGTRVLLLEPDGMYVGRWFEDGAPSCGDAPGWMGLVHDDSGFMDLQPTHWRPLPPLPEG